MEGINNRYRHSARIQLTSSSVVFIHGLFGHPYETWAWKTSKPTKSPLRSEADKLPSSHLEQVQGLENSAGEKDVVYWPGDLLPGAIPDARIYTWGYDADLANFSSASRNTIHQHAGNLLSDLVDLRAESPLNERPIIFVVHSLGGIIVKEAMNLSRTTEGTTIREIVPATSGICFLGTPHRGSRAASIGKIAFQITKAAGQRPSTKILHALERNSETLNMIGDSFSQTLTKYERLLIYSFREERLTKKRIPFLSIMVSKSMLSP